MFNSVCYENRTDCKTIPICVSCKVTNDYKHHDRKLFKSNGMQINVQYINGFLRNSTSSVSWTKTPCSQY